MSGRPHSETELDYETSLKDNYKTVKRNYEGMTGGLNGWTLEDGDEAELHAVLDGDDLYKQLTFDFF